MRANGLDGVVLPGDLAGSASVREPQHDGPQSRVVLLIGFVGVFVAYRRRRTGNALTAAQSVSQRLSPKAASSGSFALKKV
jgi:hypothetical protein